MERRIFDRCGVSCFRKINHILMVTAHALLEQLSTSCIRLARSISSTLLQSDFSTEKHRVLTNFPRAPSRVPSWLLVMELPQAHVFSTPCGKATMAQQRWGTRTPGALGSMPDPGGPEAWGTARRAGPHSALPRQPPGAPSKRSESRWSAPRGPKVHPASTLTRAARRTQSRGRGRKPREPTQGAHPKTAPQPHTTPTPRDKHAPQGPLHRHEQREVKGLTVTRPPGVYSPTLSGRRRDRGKSTTNGEVVMSAPASPVTDKNYNLIWAVQQSLENVWQLETYIKDAERQGDEEIGRASCRERQ